MFSESDRKNIIIGTLVVVALMLVCVATVGFYKSAVPEQVDHNTINITLTDYEQALAKWQSRGVTEYEMTLHSSQDDVVLHVNDSGRDITVLKALHGGEPEGSTVVGSTVLLKGMTVEKLFERVKEGLDATLSASPPQGGKFQFFSDYSVRFDPTLGYPNYYAQYNRTTKPSREITWRDDVVSPFEITSLKIVK